MTRTTSPAWTLPGPRALALLTTAALVSTAALTLAPAVARADTSSFQYTDDTSGNAVITKFTGTGDTARVPTMLGGLKVIGVASGAFDDAANLAEVIFDGNIDISEDAFRSIPLERVTFAGEIVNLEPRAFSSLASLTEVHFDGPAPQSIVAGHEESRSLDGHEDLVVSYTCDHHESAENGRFTSPVWEGYPAQGDERHTVVFETGPGSAVDDRFVDCIGTVDEPADPEAPGWTFTGWYIDEEETERFDFDTLIDSDRTLYAGWEALPPAPEEPPTGDDGVVAELVLRADAAEVAEGGTVTITATGLDAEANVVGDVTGDVTLTSSVATDVIQGNQVTFPTASEHVITATHLDGASESITITVIPEVRGEPDETESADNEDPRDGEAADQSGGATQVPDGAMPSAQPGPGDELARTGPSAGPRALALSLLLVALGALLMRRRSA